MKIQLKFALSFLTVAALIGFQACQKEEFNQEALLQNEKAPPMLKNSKMNTFYSSSLHVGGGVVRAWVCTDKDDNPLSVGINLSAKVLDNLPHEPMQYVLPMPNKGHGFYTHVLFDWNPSGHEPPGVYDKPHFDFHFYTASNELRMSIPGSLDMDLPSPDPNYIPVPYFQLPGLVPEMGAHWVDPSSPEFQIPGGFTHTFIWGSYHGQFIFWEPMITREYLMQQLDETFPIPQPTHYQNDGWYATHYEISYSENPGEYTVALVNLQFQNGQ